MMLQKTIVVGVLFFLSVVPVFSQRKYAAHSVLASGNWYKIGVSREGIYKVDMPFLNTLGINVSMLSSASIRLYGNGGGMVDENNVSPRPDDLSENAIQVVDGGDGILNGSDYFVFYAPGPHRWRKDSVNQLFQHRKNLYSDTVWYFITIGGNGKRIQTLQQAGSPTVTVTSYNERHFHENDVVNFLNSGKEWYGEECSNDPGGNASRSFTVEWPGLLSGYPAILVTDVAGRSIGVPGEFLVKLNNQLSQKISLPAVTGQFLDLYASSAKQVGSMMVSQTSLHVSYTWSSPVAGAKGWVNWFELHGRRSLSLQGNSSLFFRDWQSVQRGAVARFVLSNATEVWEVNNTAEPVGMSTVAAGAQLVFDNDASLLREYVAFSTATMLSPFAAGKVANQDLHDAVPVDFLIITHPSLLTEAQRLAAFHTQHDRYKTMVATTEQVYNEFSGGLPDPVGIRDFVKMYYDKAGNDVSKRPKYLLLFGSGSYDYRYRIPGNTNFVPCYQSANALDPLNTYTSDDFFGLLDDGDDINQNNPSMHLDIGIGRIPAHNLPEATVMVDKIIRYHARESIGAWRNQITLIADDKDNNLHFDDAEIMSDAVMQSNPVYNQNKIYLDAYPLISGSGGARYPVVNDAIVNQVFNGTLIVNYTGHGNFQRLAEEAILTQEELSRFNNPNKLPLFITATCDFAPHDDPAKKSLGAGILTGNANGAIALLTTTRVVFAFSNRQINDSYLRTAFSQRSNGKYLTLGESVQQAKNLTMQQTGDVVNNRKFTLLGNPAMRLGFPELKLQLTHVNNQPIHGTDTLRVLAKYHFRGRVTDLLGVPVTGFNGKANVIVFDKPLQKKTRGNDAASPIVAFTQQSGVLYKGDVSVTDGQFAFTCIIPKDIDFKIGKGRISLYADDGHRSANGVDTSFFIAGGGNNNQNDNNGPEIKPFINDDKFQNGGLSHENPVLLVKIFDPSGISVSGTAIGHDITAIIDGDERNVLVLNAFFTSAINSYQSGQVLFQLPTMDEGKHTIRIKAWDVANNSSEATITFVVAKREKLRIINVRNFPNPFESATTFGFEHNQPNTNLEVFIDMYTSTGVFVKGIKQIVNTGGSRNCEINWDGANHFGVKLEKTNYIYRIKVIANGQQVEAAQQLIIF